MLARGIHRKRVRFRLEHSRDCRSTLICARPRKTSSAANLFRYLKIFHPRPEIRKIRRDETSDALGEPDGIHRGAHFNVVIEIDEHLAPGFSPSMEFVGP